MIINHANLSRLFTGYKTSFNLGLQNDPKDWQQFVTQISSQTSEELYAWLGQFPGLKEWIGDRHIKNMASQKYTIINKDFESTVAVGKNAIEDDKYGVYGKLFEAMGQAAAVHPAELIFALLQAGFSTSCYDGQYFFDTDHPVGGASVSNMQAGSSPVWFLLCTNKPLKPLIYQLRKPYNFVAMTKEDDDKVFMRKEYIYGVDGRCNVGFGFWQQAFGSKATLDTANFNLAVSAQMAFKSDEGRALNTTPDTLLCGPSNRAAAHEVVKAERLANGATNTNKDVVRVIVSPYLP